MVIFLGVIITLVALVGAFEGGIPKGMDDDDGGGGDVEWRVETFSFNPILGHSTENSQSVEMVTIEEDISKLTEVRFTLTWDDEDDAEVSPGPIGAITLTNRPDQFALEIVTPWGDSQMTDYVYNEYDKEGLVSIVLPFNGQTIEADENVWEVVILCGECGDQVGRTGTYSEDDGGNSWRLFVEYDFLAN